MSLCSICLWCVSTLPLPLHQINNEEILSKRLRFQFLLENVEPAMYVCVCLTQRTVEHNFHWGISRGNHASRSSWVAAVVTRVMATNTPLSGTKIYHVWNSVRQGGFSCGASSQADFILNYFLSNFLNFPLSSNSPFPSSPAGRLEQLKPPCCHTLFVIARPQRWSIFLGDGMVNVFF